MDPRREVSLGATLGNYRLIERLGRGGMGEVYLAEHRRISRRVAIKVLLPELSANPAVVARFLAEARTASLVRHPGIVEIFDCDEADGRAFIVMELLVGETLGQLLSRGSPLSPDGELARRVGIRIARAVEAAHACGVVHRDLKPDNVFLLQGPDAQDRPVKVVDFGIAKVAGPETTLHTRTGALMGTPVYMSPEQCRGAGQVDHRSDIYALGCILFEMTCGRAPFVREGMGELISAHLSEPPPAPRTLNPRLPAALEALILELLAKDPAARPPDMAAVVAALESPGAPDAGPRTLVLPVAGEPAPVTPAHVRTVALPPVNRTTLGESAIELAGLRRRRSPALLAAAGAGVVGLAVAIALISSRGSVPAAVPGPVPVAAQPTPAPVARGPIEVTVDNLPPQARVSLDGAPIELPVRLPRESGRKHLLQIAAPGYAAQQISFAAGEDVTLRADLIPLPPEAARPTRARPQVSAVKRPVEPTKAPTPPKSAVHGITDL